MKSFRDKGLISNTLQTAFLRNALEGWWIELVLSWYRAALRGFEDAVCNVLETLRRPPTLCCTPKVRRAVDFRTTIWLARFIVSDGPQRYAANHGRSVASG